MQRSIYTHKILDTIQATGGDIIVKNGYLYIKGNLMFKFADVERNGIVKATPVTSATAGVLTYAVPLVPANSTVYSVSVTVANPTATGAQQNPLVFTIPVTTAATGTLANTDLVTQFKNLINSTNQSYSTYFVATGTTTLILTATSSYPVIIGNATPNITVTQTTQGVATAGLPANMAALGVIYGTPASQLGQGNPTNTIWISGTAGTLASASYYSYSINSALNIGENATMRVNQENSQILWVATDATNRATFITDLDNVLGGFLKDGTTVSTHPAEVVQSSATQ